MEERKRRRKVQNQEEGGRKTCVPCPSNQAIRLEHGKKEQEARQKEKARGK